MVEVKRLSSLNRWVIALVALGIVVGFTYSPILGMGFVSDDYIFVNVIHFTAERAILDNQLGILLHSIGNWSITDVVNGAPAIRPANTWLLMSDYLISGLGAMGYHMTSLLLHVFCSFLVLLLAWRLSASIWAAALAGLFFAILPIHAEAVAWVAARDHILAALFLALSLFFYVKGTRPYSYFLSLATFILALASKETAVSLPLILILYCALFQRRGDRKLLQAVQRTLPFWLILLAYVGLRFMLYGKLGAPPYAQLGGDALAYHFGGYTMFSTDPLYSDINDAQALVLAVLLVALLWIYRSRPVVVFGMLWVPCSLLVMIALPVEARYFYIPSIGVALALGGIVADPLPARAKLSRPLRLVLATFLIVVFATVLYSRNQNWRNAGDVAARILTEVKALHPTLAPTSRLVFVGVPDRLRSAFVFITGIEAAIQLTYNDPSLQASLSDSFPIVLDRLDRTYFLEYDNKKLRDRPDLIENLKEARSCSADVPILDWTFAQDTAGWEAWNDISAFGVQDRMLDLQVSGVDPIIASPVIDVSPHDIDHLEVTLSERSDVPQLKGTLYWQTLSMKDFSPAMTLAFPIQGDGVLHTYSLRLGGLRSNIGNDHLVRLRLDPSDRPAEIRIESIKIVCHP